MTRSHSLHPDAPNITNAPTGTHLGAAHKIVAGSTIITSQKIILKMKKLLSGLHCYPGPWVWAAAEDHV